MKQDNLDKIVAWLFALAKHRGIACDDAKWITYHAKNKGANCENKGRKSLIDETTGQIIKLAFKDLKEQHKQAKEQGTSKALQTNSPHTNEQSTGLLGP